MKSILQISSWTDQLQQNLSENEKNKELDKNKKLEEKNFEKMIFKMNLEIFNEFHQSLIFKKLVALLLEEHFASAASSQLLGNEAWEKYREASEEISFDNVRSKELLQELRRGQRDCKDLRSASLRALCPSYFEDSSLKEETFEEETFTDSTFTKKSFETSSFTESSLTESSLTDSSLTENSFTKSSLTKKALTRTASPRTPSQRTASTKAPSRKRPSKKRPSQKRAFKTAA